MINLNATKRNMLTCMATLFFAFANAQCPAGSVTLSTQAQVNAFPSTYPGCTQLSGNLFIGINSGTTDITNLTPLANITAVGGDFAIYNNSSLASIAGVNNITSINGYLRFTNNPQIANIDALSNLTSIGSDVKIEDNSSLTNLNGLSGVVNIGGYLDITNNDALANLNGLSNLTSIGKDIYISGNAILSDISGVQNTTFVPGGGYGLSILSNPALSICHLPNFCAYLANPASTHPRNISGNATNCISEQAVATACQTAATACPAGNVTLNTQVEVNTFGINYPNCTTINGSIYIGVNSGTSDITNLSPLENLTTIVGLINISHNQNLTTLNGLNSVTSVGGLLQLQGNSTLANLGGLSSLTSVGTYVDIATNASLSNLDGLANLTSIGGYIVIYNNDALTNLNGLSNLASIGQEVAIIDNAVLNNISGLRNATVTPNGNLGLTIKDNPALSLCNLPNFCTYLANPAGTHPRTISGNATTCATEQAVITACQTLGINDVNQVTINAYPSPVNYNLYVEVNEEVTVQVVDMLGQTVQTAQLSIGKNTLDVSKLNPGVYFIQSAAGNSLKFLKQ